MTPTLWAQIGIALLNILVIGVMVPMARSIVKLRDNEVKHLATALIEIKADIAELRREVREHVTWHLEQR